MASQIPVHARSGRQSASGASWVGQRWTRFFEQRATPDDFAEGLRMARSRRLSGIEISDGQIRGVARDKGGARRRVTLRIDRITNERWEDITQAMSEQAVYTAKLLAGALPAGIEDIFAPLGIRLFPSVDADVSPHCACGKAYPWCEHVCAVAIALGDRLDADPFLIFTLRGLDAHALIERLRQRRALDTGGGAAALAYVQRPAPGADIASEPLELSIHSFWESGPELEDLDTSLALPEISHALLKRLGPSPFEKARFPIVGLLASCYDVISAQARDEPIPGPEDASEDAAPDSETGSPP